MQLPDDWAGKQGRCPQCSKVLHIPATRPAARPESALAPQKIERPTGPLDSGMDWPAASGTHPSTIARLWRNPVWIAALLGGVALIGSGLFLLLRNDTARPADGTSAALDRTPDDDVHNEEQRRTVFRPQIKSDETNQGPAAAQGNDARASDMATYKLPGTAKPSGKETGTAAATGSWGLIDFGVSVPPGATLIEIDGVTLSIRNPGELVGERDVALVLPLGKHIVRFTKAEAPRTVEPKRWFIDAYREVAARVQDGGRWDFDRLLDQSRQSLDRFTEPLVPHFWGNYYWQEGEFDAAARHYTWALEIAPSFAPAYFNLAALAHERGHDDTAQRYLRLADLWNAQNAYGLSQALSVLRAALGELNAAVADDEPDWYVPTRDALTVRDRDMVAVLHSTAEFSPRIAERAKILNNLGAYFEHVGKPEYALQSYRSAAAVLGTAKLSSEERLVIQGILENLSRVCRKADMPEYRRYERLQAMMH
jgi:hypothetical protein